MIGSSIGPYEVVARLGAGGMGDVYLARDTRLSRHVALKSLSDPSLDIPEARERLLREARAAARLAHPNIAAIHDILDGDPRPCIVMEYVQGQTLAAKLTGGRLPPPQVLAIGIQLADALAHAHAAGVIHRDLKPGNVIVTSAGTPKILDFGVARIRELAPGDATTETLDDPTQSRTGHLVGTPSYMAPEQLAGRPASAQSDIYALGALLFELLTGHRPFVGSDFMALALAIVSAPTPIAHDDDPSVPEDVSAIVARAMAKDPGGRYQSASEMKAALERAARALRQQETVDVPGPPRGFVAPAALSPRDGTVPAGPRWLTRSRIVALAAIASLAIALVVWITALGPRADTPIVGVLPLDNLSGDAAKDYVGVGVSDSLVTALLRVRPVTVISRAETGGYLGRGQSPAKIARDHGATYLVSGGVHQAGDRVRFSVQMIRPDGRVVVSNSYEGASDDLLALQRRAAGDLIGALGLKLTSSERQRADRPATSNADAYADYSIGRALLDRKDVSGNIEKAIASFEQATRKDPQFAEAHVGLGEACWAKYDATHDPAWVPRAVAAVQRALAIAPDDPAAHVALASIYIGTGRHAEAVAELQRALSVQPNNDTAHRLMGQAFGAQGRIADAIREFERAIAIRPNYLGNYLTLGTFHFHAARFADAARAYRRATEVHSDSALAFQNLGAAQLASGDDAAALENFTRALTLDPQNDLALSNIGYIHYKAGRFADAASAFERAVTLVPRNPMSHRNLGDALGRLGETARARSEYEQAVSLSDELLKVNPLDARRYAERGIYAAKAGRADAAIASALRAAELAPDNAEVLYRCAAVYALVNRPTDAVVWLSRALEKGYSRSLARTDDDLASIRKLPQVEELLRDSR